jgi:hypothetical protein
VPTTSQSPMGSISQPFWAATKHCRPAATPACFSGSGSGRFPWLFFFAATESLSVFLSLIFCAQVLFNGLHSFWGNYLPGVYPTYLRGTGESFAMNIGGRILGVSAALATTQLSNIMPGGSAATRLSYSAGTTVVLAIAVFLMMSFRLPEPRSDQLPD